MISYSKLIEPVTSEITSSAIISGDSVFLLPNAVLIF